MHGANGWNERRVGEMPALLRAERELAVAQHNLEAAHSWLSMWVQVDAVSHRYILHRRQPRGTSGYRSRDQQ